jgi:hypothetical protein
MKMERKYKPDEEQERKVLEPRPTKKVPTRNPATNSNEQRISKILSINMG